MARVGVFRRRDSSTPLRFAQNDMWVRGREGEKMGPPHPRGHGVGDSFFSVVEPNGGLRWRERWVPASARTRSGEDGRRRETLLTGGGRRITRLTRSDNRPGINLCLR